MVCKMCKQKNAKEQHRNIMACGMEKLSIQRCDKIYDHKHRNCIVCHKYDASRWMCLAVVKAQGHKAQEAKHESSEVICTFSLRSLLKYPK